MNGIKERDYLNFFEMLKFWITQTDNNITNNGKRVSKSYLDKNNIGDVGKYFKDPLFKEEYIKFNDKYLKINFFSRQSYEGEANYVGWEEEKFFGYINIVYDYKNKKIKALYKDKYNKRERKEYEKFINYMKQKGYIEGLEKSIDNLGLDKEEPNDDVKELFDYFYNMIEDAKKYLQRKEEENIRVDKLEEKL